jgi:hypothetical protein
MTHEEYTQFHRELGFSFSTYVTTHLEWPVLEHLTDETTVVFQTDDPDFNAKELEFVKRCREKDDVPDRPATLIYVKVPSPPSVENIDWGQAKVLARFIIKPEPLKA